MINHKEFINESKLSKLMQVDERNIVNLNDDGFEYCNGYLIVECTYDLDIVIQKLFKIGAITNYRNWTPTLSTELGFVTKCENELEAIKTPYLKDVRSKGIVNIFKIGDKFVSYQKEYVDIFKNVQYRASNDGILPNLRIYVNEEFIGVIMPLRDEHDLLSEIYENKN
ncbi:hypothetical protein [Clostridium estertheticum]|uniref:Uncharacterized protein n=1 Tax=Clostridium estertheticum subsp. estertheticum TaxID=1552 RepID=A0A1J0GJL6_9CLOT|nr:hypothetical protein [Clostridium estertheticum]APC41556.1 hypothetical protein A7L45_16460 [Clostridium estertheticum subsp. estertheticum]